LSLKLCPKFTIESCGMQLYFCISYLALSANQTLYALRKNEVHNALSNMTSVPAFFQAHIWSSPEGGGRGRQLHLGAYNNEVQAARCGHNLEGRVLSSKSHGDVDVSSMHYVTFLIAEFGSNPIIIPHMARHCKSVWASSFVTAPPSRLVPRHITCCVATGLLHSFCILLICTCLGCVYRSPMVFNVQSSPLMAQELRSCSNRHTEKRCTAQLSCFRFVFLLLPVQ
jgi:hypothetical protein